MRHRCRSGREWAAVLAAGVVQVDAEAVVVVPAAGAVARVAALVAAVARREDKAAGDAAKVAVDRVADVGATGNRVTAMVGAATAAVSSSRTSSPSTESPRS
jgi:hypothetical protein